MRAYLSILKVRFIMLLQYRVAAIAGGCTQLLFGFIMIMILDAFYSSSTAIQPISFSQTVTYMWLNQALLATVMPWGGDNEIETMIRSGNVAYELCRPVDLYNLWFSRAIALRTAPTILRAIPIAAVAFLVPGRYSLQLPASLQHFLAWILAMIGSVFISAAITNLINVSTLWTISGLGFKRLIPAFVIFASGALIPLPLFPQWLRTILDILPFSGLVDIPMRFYTGHLSVSMLFPLFGKQLLWAITLIWMGRMFLKRSMKQVVVQGG